MKSLKKGIALIAVLAFLITAALPAAGLAAGGAEPRVAPQTMVAGEEGTISFSGGFSNAENGVCPYGRYTITSSDGGPEIPISGLNITDANAAGTRQNVVITIPAGTPGFTEAGGPWNYDLNFQMTGAPQAVPVASFELTVNPAGSAETYTATAAGAENGTITLSTSLIPAGASTVTAAANVTVTVTAAPAEGYKLVSITTDPETDVTMTGENTATFRMPAADVTVNAAFAVQGQSYEIFFAEGVDSWLGASLPEYEAGEEAELAVADLTAIPEGNGITSLKVVWCDAEGNAISPETAVPVTYVSPTSYTFIMPDSAVLISAQYGPVDPEQENPVELPAGVTADTEDAVPGTPVTITVPQNPDGSYPAMEVIGADGTVYALTPVPGEEGQYTFVMPAQSVSVKPVSAEEPQPAAAPAPVYAWSGIDRYDPAGGPVSSIQVAEQWEGPATVTLQSGCTWDTSSLPAGISVSGSTLTILPAAFNKSQVQPLWVSYKDAAGTVQRIAVWKGAKITASGNVGFTSDNPFTYWVQPVSGLFGQDEGNQNLPGYAVEDFKIGPVAWERGGERNELKVNERVQIYVDPANIQFTNPATGAAEPPALTYSNWQDYVTMQWEYKPSQSGEDDGNAREIPAGLGFAGVRSPLLTISPLTASMDGWQVRLVVWKNGTQEYKASKWIELDIDGIDASVIPEVTVTSYPEAAGSFVNVPETADVTLTASVQDFLAGSPITWQWQSKAPATADNPDPAWTNITGGDTSVLKLEAVTQAMSGTSYQCRAVNNTGSVGVVGVSAPLTLNVTAPDGSVIISAPTAEILYQFIEGRTLSTGVTARTDNGQPVSYQWYVKSYQGPVPGGDQAITTIPEAAAYVAAGAFVPVSGAASPFMTSDPLTEGVYVFRCRVQNAENDAKAEFSQPMYVVVSGLGSIRISPAENETRSVGVLNGKAVTLSPVISGGSADGLSYSWQVSEDGGLTWADLTATTASLTLPNLTTMATGSRYRLVVKSGGAAKMSGSYLLNVWDTANTPVVKSSPLSQNAAYADLSTGRAAVKELKSTATVSQANNVKEPVSVIWYKNTPEGPVAVASAACPVTAAAARANVRPVTPVPDTDNPVWLASVTEDSLGHYSSTLTLNPAYAPGIPGKGWTENVNGTYFCAWFKMQNPDKEVCRLTQAPNTEELLAPQAASGPAVISISIAGNPKINSQNDCPVTAAVGQSASFWVNAVLNPNPGDKLPTYLVYTWQKSTDYDPDNAAAAEWTNVLTTDGTGQFTSRYTTAPITQLQYDENYNPWFRVIIANRATGTKIVSDPCHLILTEGTPSEPALTPGAGSSIQITGTAPDRFALGVTVSKDGTTVQSFLTQLNMTVPAGYTLRVVSSDGTALADDAILCTGCVLQLVKDADNAVVDSAVVIVAGDVLGNGIIAINQVVRMAQDLNGTRPLEGIYEMAGDFNGNGSIDIADLVREAQILNEEINVNK